MAVTVRRAPGQHALEAANPDRVRFQRGARIDTKDAGRRRKSKRKH